MRAASPERWQQIWDDSKVSECPICTFAPPHIVFDGPMNSDVPTRCTHWACTDCWDQLARRRDFHCPLCRDCLAEWHAWRRSADESDDDMEEEPPQGTLLSEAYLRFFYAERDQVTMRLQNVLSSAGTTVFLGVVLIPPALSGRTLGFSQSLMATVEELARNELTGEELAALPAES